MEASVLKNVDISLVEISGANPRKDVKGESFKELKASIAEHGILQPLIVRPKGGTKYELVAGERRLTAAKELKLETVPVTIRQLDDHSARVLMLLENLQREDLQPLEEAAALEELLKPGQQALNGKPFMTQAELAQKISKSQPWIANRLRLHKAPKVLKDLVAEEKLTPQHVMELLPFVDYKIFTETLLPEIKDMLKRGPMTVEQLKFEIERDLGDGETTLDLMALTWETGHLHPFFDLTGCEGCKDMITANSSRRNRGEKSKICLNRTCWADRLNKAKQEHDKVKKQEDDDLKQSLEKKLGKKVKSLTVDTSRLEYNSYTSFYSKEFDLTDCKNGCEFYKQEKGRNSTLDGDKEPRHVCLKPSCYRGKKAQTSRIKNKAVRQELAFVDESLETYLSGRSTGFTLEELKYICERIADIASHTYGRGEDLDDAIAIVKNGSAIEIECSILRVLTKGQLGPIRQSLSMDDLKSMEKEVPFKISREKTEAPQKAIPNCKKVQEKRKKKVS